MAYVHRNAIGDDGTTFRFVRNGRMRLHRFCADVLRVFVGLSRATARRYPFGQAVTAFVYLGCWFLMAGIV